ncbi:MAG: hypothetical protein JNJ52_05720 [Flavobacterium sp.]|nr:hypothetical protein [Flavobacterium sp.]
MNPIIETWQIHNRINLYLLHSIDELYLSSVSLSKGRTVGEHFAHIHNVRLMWLKAAMPDLLSTVEKIEKDNITKAILITQLNKSEEAISKLIENALQEGKLKGFKPHPTAFLGYLISHESHHRGQITMCLKQSGHPIDKKIAFGLWEWGNK